MSYYNEATPDALLYSEVNKLDNVDIVLDYSLNQFEMANIVRDCVLRDTISCFAEVIPYEIVITIFNETTYKWNDLFVNKLLDVLKSGVYGNNLTVNEKILIKDYVDFKYNNTIPPSPLLTSLDEYIGAL